MIIIMFIISTLSLFLFLSIAENSFAGTARMAESDKVKLPRRTIISRIPVIGFMYQKTEDWVSGVRFIMMNDLGGLLAVVFYALFYSALSAILKALRKAQPAGWFGISGIITVILCIMLIVLAIRFIYEGGDSFFHELLPFVFVSIVTVVRASQAAAYASCLAHGGLAKLIQVTPMIIFAIAFIAMVVCFVICTILNLMDKKKNSA